MDAKQFNINGTSILLKDEAARNRLTAVEGKIPSDASSENKLITKTVNDLLNYYLKSETYTKAEVEALIGAIQHFHYEVYASTSAVTTPASNVLYLIGPTGSGADKYEEYVYSNNTWVKIGDTSIDLSGYVTTEALNTALAAYTTTANLTTLLAGKQDVISDLATIRSGAAAGATAYQKPSGGIPKTDLASGVQDSLDLADESLQYTLSGQVDPSVTPGSYVTRSDIVDNLTTDDATKILSAKQGKVLGDAVSQLGQKVDGYSVGFLMAGARRELSAPIPKGSTILSVSEYVVDGKITLYQENDNTGTVFNIADFPVVTNVIYVAAKLPGDNIITAYINIAGISQENDLLQQEVVGGERQFYFRASGSVGYAPLRKGDIIIAASDGVTSFVLRETPESTNESVTSFPFICHKDYGAIVKYISGSPYITITFFRPGVEETIREIDGVLTKGVYRTYSRKANGADIPLTPPIKKGDVIISANCEGLASFGLYDANNVKTSVAISALPFDADKDYVSYAAYVSNSPDMAMVVYTKSVIDDIVELKETIEAGIDEKFPETFVPKKIYGVIGDTLQLFVRGIVRSNMPYRFYNKFICAQGKVYDRYLEVTPALLGNQVPTELTISHKLVGDSYNESEEKVADFAIAQRPITSPSSNINVLCIGASTTQNGEWVSELKRRLTGTRDTGTPNADGLTNINFVGRKEAAGVHLEATGGWQWKSFYTPQDAIRFQVTGITSVNIGDIYTFTDASSNVVKVQVAEVNVTGDAGNIRFIYNYDSESLGVPTTASGTISRISGSGDATITYISFAAENYCPFAGDNPGECSFTDYANTYCDGHIDVAIILLGALNSGVIGDASLDGVIADMKVMLDALHTDFPNCKVILGTPIGVSQQHGAEYNYGAASDYTQWSIMYVDFRYAQALQDFINGNDYKDWCFLANPLGEVDSEYVFPTTSKPVNVRMSTPTEEIGTNGAHPTNAGYMMTADSFYRCFANEML